MKKHSILASILLTGLVATAAVAPAPAMAPLVTPLLLAGHGVNAAGGIFFVEAHGDANGTEWGTAQYTQSNGKTYQVTLDCIYVDGGTAYVSGEVTSSPDGNGMDSPLVGWGWAIRIKDNGSPGSAGDEFGVPRNFTGGPFPGVVDIAGFRNFYDGFLDNTPGATAPFVQGNMVVEG